MSDPSASPPIDVLSVISKGDMDYGAGILTAVCPVCKSTYNHLNPPRAQGHQSVVGSVVLPLWGECGSEWEICTEVHKGQTTIFVRVLKSCADPKVEAVTEPWWKSVTK